MELDPFSPTITNSQFKWTVNWKFLSEDMFVGTPLALALLAATVTGYAALFLVKWPKAGSVATKGRALSASYVVLTLFASNFLGVAFARTLHYQFYSWYFHQLPLLLWSCGWLPGAAVAAVLAAVEMAFNVYPATARSSLLLQAAHALVLAAVATTTVPPPREDDKKAEGKSS
jgi:alpha-1,3-mannosyltransferase